MMDMGSAVKSTPFKVICEEMSVKLEKDAKFFFQNTEISDFS